MNSCTPSPSRFSFSMSKSSTAASSPPPTTDAEEPSEKADRVQDEEFEARYARLNALLEKSAIYTSILKEEVDKVKLQCLSTPPSKQTRRAGKRTGKPLSKRVKYEDEPVAEEEKPTPRFEQPALITGATLKDYQLEGVQWMIGLHKNGISGILADEMGLGKTLQTIAFNAYLRSQRVFKPFLVVCPLSVLHNWQDEWQKFAPDVPVCMYHGTPAERADLRNTVMRVLEEPTNSAESPVGNRHKPKAGGRGKRKGRGTARRAARSGMSKTSSEKEVGAESADQDEATKNQLKIVELARQEAASKFPVVLTTYDILMRDQAHLAKHEWSYIVVDEGHRLKNMDCKLMKEIKKLNSGGRVVLTGTPLHNNLAELWSLLNFILPDIFDDLDAFQEWFNLSTMQSTLSHERSSALINTLHGILKPFLLRRVKADVLSSSGWFDEQNGQKNKEANGDDLKQGLPPKKEYVLWAPLTVRQREVYDNVLGGGLRKYLLGKMAPKKDEPANDLGPRRLRSAKGTKRKRYDDEEDDEYFKKIERGENIDHPKEEEDLEELGRLHQYKSTLKQVNNMKLQNTVMQLRKVCSHPFLFDWPLDAQTREPVLGEELIRASGKMMVLEKLLDELFRRGHKVLLFSQFVTMLDIIEAWATERFSDRPICRIDGSTPPLERREQMNIFQTSGDALDAPYLFLLSTRAGGLGINLTAADTVIFYDQDWNPQMDVQAQDRAHRIGQTKPVLIFRLISAHTIEEKIMQRATEKRKLEALIIAKGKFKAPTAAPKGKTETMAEMAAALLKLEGEKIDVVSEDGKAGVLSNADLDLLLDRSPEVFSGRAKGWSSSHALGGDVVEDENQAVGKTAFAVYEGRVDETDDVLAGLMGDDMKDS